MKERFPVLFLPGLAEKNALKKKQCFKSDVLFQCFFSKIYPNFYTFEAIFQKKVLDKKRAVLVILPPANLSFFSYGLRFV